jgi:tryptophan-rich sensory protein
MRIKILITLVSILISEGIGIIGSFFTTPSIGTWYKTLNKPSFNPPNWIFGPVWTTLFLLIGASLALVWLAPPGSPYKNAAITAFTVQLILNLAWSIIFFYYHSPLFAFYDIILLLVAIAINIYYAFIVNPIAGWLLLPYMLWVAFASVLNYNIWRLNS